MGRLGMKDVEEYKDVVDIINKKMILFLKACLHFASADEPGDSMNEQYEFLKILLIKLKTKLHSFTKLCSFFINGWTIL